MTQALEDRIRVRAYQLYEERGRLEGHALEDWLKAETELLPRLAGRAEINPPMVVSQGTTIVPFPSSEFSEKNVEVLPFSLHPGSIFPHPASLGTEARRRY